MRLAAGPHLRFSDILLAELHNTFQGMSGTTAKYDTLVKMEIQMHFLDWRVRAFGVLSARWKHSVPRHDYPTCDRSLPDGSDPCHHLPRSG